MEDPTLWDAHMRADYAVMDSGYVDWILRMRGVKPMPPRISGYQVIEYLLKPSSEAAIPFRERKILWVVPSAESGEKLRTFLDDQGFDSTLLRYYEAPFYESEASFNDEALALEITEFSPNWIVLGIGGGRQERLGAFLRSRFQRSKAIIATGAAIGFFTGEQVRIPRWADRVYLGWLLRLISAPYRFFPRYLGAIRLPFVLNRTHVGVAREAEG